MRKYWYYTYEAAKSFGNRICYSDSGEFDLAERLESLEKKMGNVIIKGWHEISSSQYEKLMRYFDNNKK